MTDVYLHVGFPKTGTSFLQQRCLPNLKNVHVVTQRPVGQPTTGVIEKLWQVAARYPLFVDMDETRAEVNRLFREVTHDKILISSEHLIGDGIWSFYNHTHITEALHKLFPTGKIILTIRRQDDFLESLYRQYVRSYHYPTIDSYLVYTDHQFTDWIRPPWVFPSINVWRLDYYTYVQNYVATFGRKNVLVLPYELLRDDPLRFHTNLAAFIGVEPYYPSDGTV
jgi:hypothetical protein